MTETLKSRLQYFNHHAFLRTRPPKRSEDSDTMGKGSSPAIPATRPQKKRKTMLDGGEADSSDIEPPLVNLNKSASKGKSTDVLAEADKPKLIPKHLPGLEMPDGHIYLPVVLILSNGTAVIRVFRLRY